MRTVMAVLGGRCCLRRAGRAGRSRRTTPSRRRRRKRPRSTITASSRRTRRKAGARRRDADGNVVVKGKARVDDIRNKADLGQPELAGSSAKLWLTIAPNGSYAAKDNWWDVSFTIPSSAAVTEVTVNCDSERVFADLKVKPAK